MTTKKTEDKNWIFEEDTNGAKTQAKIFGESKVKEFDNLLKDIEKTGATDDIMQKLINAKLEDIATMTNAYQENMATVLGGMLQNTMVIGKEFDELRKFNATEQALKDEAVLIVKNADAALADAKTWGDWRNIFFNWKNRAIETRTKLVTDAMAKAQELDIKAAMIFDERLRNAKIDEQLDQFRHMTEIILNKLNGVSRVNMEQYEQIEVRHDKAVEIVAKAAKELERLLAEFQTTENKLADAKGQLVNFVNGTPQYAEQVSAIDNIQQEYDRIKTERDKMQAAYNSKEKFAAILQTNMTALKMSAGNITALAVKLRSDNEERVYTYANTIQLILAAKTQETGSAINTVGDETDQKNLEIAVTVASASEKDAIERLYQHPENMKRALKVMDAFSQILAKDQEKMKNYQDMIKGGYLNNGNGSAPNETPAEEKRMSTEDIFANK